MALVTLLARHYRSLDVGNHKTRLHAFIVDHKLRDNSTEEAEFVAEQVRKLGMHYRYKRVVCLDQLSSCSHIDLFRSADVTPHVLTLDWSASSCARILDNDEFNLTTTTQRPDKVHLETKARLERYKAIARQCRALQIKDIFVGHHSGDQVETVLFRLSRASGIDGLSGIQDVASFGVMNVVEALDINVLRPLLNVSKVCHSL